MFLRISLAIVLLLALPGSGALAQVAEPALQDAVQAYDSRMSLTSDPELLKTADFNGDGRPDVAAVLEGGGRSALVIFNRTASGYAPHALYASLPSAGFRLRVVPAGRYRTLDAGGMVEIGAAAVELVFPGRSSAMYVWAGDRNQVHPTENYH